MEDPFVIFKKSCSKYFDFLVHEFAFQKGEPNIHPPECSIEYRKDQFVLDIIHEYGDYPWIRVSISGKENSLDNIIKNRYPDCKIKRKSKTNEDKIDSVLSQYSVFLKKNICNLGSLS